MAFQVNMNPLLQGSQAIGQSLSDVGEAAGNYMQRNREQEQQTEMNALVNRALQGDPEALGRVSNQNPELGIKITDRLTSQGAAQTEQVDAATLEGIKRYHLAPDDQKEAVLRQLIDDPSLDIDGEDIPIITNPNEFRSRMTKALGKDAADAWFGGKVASPEQLANIDIKKQELEFKKLDAAEKALDRKLQRETNELKKSELQSKIADKKKEKIALQNKKEVEGAQAVTAIDDALSVADELINHEGLDAAVGGTSFFPTIPGSEAANFEAKLEQFQSKQFLTGVEKMKGMGALSENEGKKIAAAAGALKLGMSEAAFRKEMDIILSGLKKAKEFTHKKYGVPMAEEAEEVVANEVITAPKRTGQASRNRQDVFSQYGVKL